MTLARRKQPAWGWFAAGLVATGCIGIMDATAHHGLSFPGLYFAPVPAVTWPAERVAGGYLGIRAGRTNTSNPRPAHVLSINLETAVALVP